MIAVLLAIRSPFQSATVPLHSDAMPAKAIVAEIARQTGERLVCDAVVAGEPIVVDFEKAPLHEVMARLARVIGGEWRDSRGERRLTRSSTLATKLEREETAYCAKVIAELGAVFATSTKCYLFDLNVYAMAYHDSMKGSKDFLGTGPPREYTKFRPAFQYSHVFTIRLGPNEFTQRILFETIPLPGSTFEERDALPGGLRAAMAGAKEELRKQTMGAIQL